MVKCAVFDVDGTLIDSNDGHAEAWRMAFQQFGHRIPFEKLRPQIGKGADHILPLFLTPAEIKARGESISKARGEIVKERFLPKFQPFPEVRALFEELRCRGVRIALASSAKKDELAAYKGIAHIEDLTEKETSSDDAPKSKPEPDIFEAALGRLGHPAKDKTLVFGDTPYDAEAAGKAGLRTVAVLCGGFPEADLRRAGAVAIYQNPADLLANLDAILALG